jgi:transcriptional regulator with XRE-family HTH domain
MARRVINVDPTFAARLRELREARGMAYRDFGTTSRTYVNELERGIKRPTPEIAQILDQALDAGGTLSALVTIADSRQHRPAADTQPETVDLEPLAAGIRSDDEAHQVIDIAVADIISRYEAEGPAALAGETTRLRRQLDVRDRRGPAVMRGAAQTCGLLAYMAVNLGRFAHADAYALEAFALAREAGDTGLMAWIRGTQSFAAYYRQRYDQAVTFARDGLTYAGDGPQAIRLHVNCEARALAFLPGRRREAETAVGRAYELADAHHVPAGLGPCIAFDPYPVGRVIANAITVHQTLGQPDRALVLIDQIGATLAESDSAWSRALIGLDHAATLLQQPDRDVDHAMAIASTAVDAAAGSPITSIVQRGRALVGVDKPWGRAAAAVELRDRLRVMAQPLRSAG